jgi:multidrug resistance protein, MATE family
MRTWRPTSPSARLHRGEFVIGCWPRGVEGWTFGPAARVKRLLLEVRPTLALAGPIIVGQVSQMLMGITDSIMIGRVGKVPLAASAFAGSLWGVAFLLGLGLLIPVAVLVARAHGGGRDAEAGDWLRHGVVLAVAVSLLVGLLMLALTPWLTEFGQPPEVVAAMRPYYEILVVSILPTLLFQTFRQFAEAMGRPWVPMGIMLGGVAFNVFLNWVFIYGNLGMPALGLAGAGWATLISRVTGVALIVVWLHRTPVIRSAWPRDWRRGLALARYRVMFGLGVPAAACLLFEAGAFTAAAIMMGWLGATALAAHQIAISCAAFAFMFPLGLSMALSLRIGRAIGAGESHRLRPIFFSAQLMTVLFMSGTALTFALAGRLMAAGFVTEVEVITLAAQLLVIAAIFQLFDGSQVVSTGALRGLTDVKIPTLINFVAYWVLALPAAYLLGFKGSWGPVGVWVGLAAGLAVAALALLARFLRRTRATPPYRPSALDSHSQAA